MTELKTDCVIKQPKDRGFALSFGLVVPHIKNISQGITKFLINYFKFIIVLTFFCSREII